MPGTPICTGSPEFGRLDDPEHYRQCVQREATRAPVRPFLDYGICHFREAKRTVVRYDRIPEGIIDPSECLFACFVGEPLYLCAYQGNVLCIARDALCSNSHFKHSLPVRRCGQMQACPWLRPASAHEG